MAPFFSIILPMYNRERFISRAISSCLRQDFVDFEIVVVDDGSADRSVAVVESIGDPRIRVITCATNQERLIARNTGARASSGEWLIWFDSDDELVPGALAIMKERIAQVPKDVRALRFMCRLDSGRVSPDPPHKDETWNYEGYIRWVELHRGKWSEAIPVVHRETIQSVLFPEDRFFTGETQYHLDLASKYRIQACSDVLRLYHLDAENNTSNPNTKIMVEGAPMVASRLERVISVHGRDIERWAPQTYKALFSGMITQYLLSGQRWKASHAFLRGLTTRNLFLRTWVIMAIGMVNSKLLARTKASYGKRRSLPT
jgi:glycosyltransferase involved in cell wall biosynthesis